jgi:hypothetical protein
MKKYREYPLALILTYLAFSFITNNFNPTQWEKTDKIMCLIFMIVICASRIFIDEKADK